MFVDGLLATLIHLRHGVTHDVLGCWFGVSSSTSTAPSPRFSRCWPITAALSSRASGCARWSR
ncbi:transposase family protein [Actinomadura sp. NTSP31]|uniref:transposase family protein n=1 Tax=Actinomadura sp. NTSP31 TaxID=1735447 RepID=UPI0035C0F092